MKNQNDPEIEIEPEEQPQIEEPEWKPGDPEETIEIENPEEIEI